MGTAYIELLATVLWMVSFRAAYLAWAWGSGLQRWPTGARPCAVPKLAPYSELAFPVPVRPLCKATSHDMEVLHRRRRALQPGKGQIRD